MTSDSNENGRDQNPTREGWSGKSYKFFGSGVARITLDVSKVIPPKFPTLIPPQDPRASQKV